MSFKIFCLSIAVFSLSLIEDATGTINFLITANERVNTLNVDQVSYIYLGKKKMWDDGTSVIAYRLPNNSKSTQYLLQEYLEMNSKEYADYWRKKLFTGELLPPIIVSSEEELVSRVCKQEGAIGFIGSKLKLPETCHYIKIKE